MGASSSTEPKVSLEQHEVEAEAASTGALPMLRKAFSELADPETNAVPLKILQQCFSAAYKGQTYAGNLPDLFPVLLDHVGSSIVDQFFVPNEGGVTWVEFVRGYNKCCARTSASMSLNMLLRLFLATTGKANVPLDLQFESDDADCKANLRLPDLDHLVLSAITSCAKLDSGMNAWNSNISSLEVQLSTGQFVTWVLSTVPCLPDCLRQYFHARLQTPVIVGDDLASPNSSVGDILSTNDFVVLTCGRAWAISLTQRSTINEEISRSCFPSSRDKMDENLLYRSSTHGRGLNRFWSNVEGYKGPLLFLVSASSGNTQEGSSDDMKWVLGALTDQGFENKDIFYGSSGCLYAISPVFHVFPPTGKDKNFVYCHLHPTARMYEPRPKPVGIAFGGIMGNERIFIDEDFVRLTVRHHVVDKTYQPGSLLPDQGFLPTEALISEVEVWGFGGKVAKEVQTSYKRREELFTAQRRKVDLKTFASWEDSPEKLMMDMMSDPNAVRKEDR